MTYTPEQIKRAENRLAAVEADAEQYRQRYLETKDELLREMADNLSRQANEITAALLAARQA